VKTPFAFDFETHAIEPRPHYPPTPVGVAINAGFDTSYYAWGHPSGNTLDSIDMVRQTARAWLEMGLLADDVLGHNISFDLAVAHEQMGLPIPDGQRINDTMFLAFLLDPYGELSLKPLAERYLGIRPEERDAVKKWLEDNKVVRRGTTKKWAAEISKAPGDLVGTYAIGDVDRTAALYRELAPCVESQGMWGAYRRECDLVPMLLENSKLGVPLNAERLERDTLSLERVYVQAETELRKVWRDEIGSTPPDNFDSNDELADSLEKGRLRLPRTPTGKRSVAKDTVLAVLPDGRAKGLLLYRSALQKTLSTYMRPWLEQGGALHCNWNQVRNYEDNGSRTGRLSSSPNLQNITGTETYGELLRNLHRWGCTYPWIRLPNLRSYIEAPEGYLLFAVDYSQQELRMLAHFEDEGMCAAFNADPNLDMHQHVVDMVKEVALVSMSRKHAKAINFLRIYGGGVPLLGERLGIDRLSAQRLIDAYEMAFPGVAAMQREVKQIAARGEPITTLGGRLYFAEPARIINGERRTFDYKLLNYLIQGSSADQTKQAMVNWYQHIKCSPVRFLLTVHDEIVGMAPAHEAVDQAHILAEHMRDAFKLGVPVGTDITIGRNYGAMEKL
jgi:DNA polymerase I-like protein with 3'-5' exonuclease and polymerase domains